MSSLVHPGEPRAVLSLAAQLLEGYPLGQGSHRGGFLAEICAQAAPDVLPQLQGMLKGQTIQ